MYQLKINGIELTIKAAQNVGFFGVPSPKVFLGEKQIGIINGYWKEDNIWISLDAEHKGLFDGDSLTQEQMTAIYNLRHSETTYDEKSFKENQTNAEEESEWNDDQNFWTTERFSEKSEINDSNLDDSIEESNRIGAN